MRRALWTTIGLVGATVFGTGLAPGCAFPLDGGSAPVEQNSTFSGDFSPTPEPLLVVAYQATGVRAGKQATLSQAHVSFSRISDGAEAFQSDDCVGYRAPAGGALSWPGEDVGELRIEGGLSTHRCQAGEDGSYGCDLPENEAFFAPGAKLSLHSGGTTQVAPFAFAAVAPPRAPEPQVDLGSLFDRSGDIGVRWTPSQEAVPMTCLQLESFDAAGRLTGFVQCDVADAAGEAQVPAQVAQVLDRQAPLVRAALFSVDGSETMEGGWWRGAYFGQGRFVELHR